MPDKSTGAAFSWKDRDDVAARPAKKGKKLRMDAVKKAEIEKAIQDDLALYDEHRGSMRIGALKGLAWEARGGDAEPSLAKAEPKDSA